MQAENWSFHHFGHHIIVSADMTAVPFLSCGTGSFDVNRRVWKWNPKWFLAEGIAENAYRESFVGKIDEILEPLDWCYTQFGENWRGKRWGSKVIVIHMHFDSRKQFTEYNFRCEFHFSDPDDLALFKLSWAN